MTKEVNKSVVELKWKFVKANTYPYFDKWVPGKTKLMETYEKKTGKRSIYKITKTPIGNSTKGNVILTKGFLKWKKQKVF